VINQNIKTTMQESTTQQEQVKSNEHDIFIASNSDKDLLDKSDIEKENNIDKDISLNIEKPKDAESLQPNNVHPQESDIQKVWDRLESKTGRPNDIIHDCLFKSFGNATDICNFCFYNFESLFKELLETDGLGKNIRRLIQHCNEYKIEEYLWSCLEKERQNYYKEFYIKWKQAIEEYQQSQDNSNKKRTVDPIDQFKPSSFTRDNLDDAKNKDHPLSGKDRNNIRDWFFNTLDTHEKSQILTAALFEGMNRKLMEPISQEMERIFFEKI